MSESSSSVPGEISDSEVDPSQSDADAQATVDLQIDEGKMEAWHAVKADYEVEPGEPVPNSPDQQDRDQGDDGADGGSAESSAADQAADEDEGEEDAG